MNARWKTLLSLACLLSLAGWAQADGATEQKLSLSNVIERALKSYPEIESARAKVRQAEARQQTSPSLPPPMVSVGSMGSSGPFSGLMENSIEVRQSLPFPSKLTAESRQRGRETQAVEEQLKARAFSVRAAAKSAFLELYRARELIGLLEEKRRTLEEHAKRIRSVTLSDRMSQAHLVRTTAEIGLAENEIEKARQQEKVAQGTLNVVLSQDPADILPSLEEPPLSEIPKAQASAEHPLLSALRSNADALEAGESVAKSQWLPDLTFKYRYNRRYDGVMPNNSEAMVGLELPFAFFWQPKGKAAEARAQVDDARAQVRLAESELKLRVLKARSEAESLKTRLENFNKVILPQAQKRLKIAHSITPTDMESLNEHRESMESYVDLRLAALNVRVDYEKAVTDLESLIGERSP